MSILFTRIGSLWGSKTKPFWPTASLSLCDVPRSRLSCDQRRAETAGGWRHLYTAPALCGVIIAPAAISVVKISLVWISADRDTSGWVDMPVPPVATSSGQQGIGCEIEIRLGIAE